MIQLENYKKVFNSNKYNYYEYFALFILGKQKNKLHLKLYYFNHYFFGKITYMEKRLLLQNLKYGHYI